MIEKEIKILLSQNQYKKILDTFNFEEEFKQTNNYYLCEGASVDATIRIREKGNLTKLQVKIPKKRDKSLHIKEEYEEEVTEIPLVISKDKLKKMSGYNFPNDAIYTGKLRTERRIYAFNDDIEIALDVNQYLGITDYELEIEYKNIYPIEIIEKLKLLNIPIDNVAEGKNTRFCKKLYEIEG